MEIKASTILDRERLLRFSHYVAASKKVFWTIIGIYFLIDTALFVVLGILNSLSPRFIFLYGIAVLFILYVIFMYFGYPYLYVKKAKNLNAVSDFVFLDDKFEIETETDSFSERFTCRYDTLFKVAKNGDDVYLFLAKGRASIVDVSSLSDEQKLQLAEALRGFFPKKRFKWKV